MNNSAYVSRHDLNKENGTKKNSFGFLSSNATNPYKQEKEVNCMSPKAFAKTELEKEIVEKANKIKTNFYSNGSFVTTLPDGEVYGDKFDEPIMASMYVKELIVELDDICAFNVQYVDNLDGYTKSWFVSLDEQKNMYHLHATAETNINPIHFEYSGTRAEFMSMVDELIEETSGCILKNATIFQ